MLRFFSRRKIKGGRAEQKAGVRNRTGPGGRVSKHALPCNIMLLDGSDLALEIGVSFSSFLPPFLLLLLQQLTCLPTCLPPPHMNIGHYRLLPHQPHTTPLFIFSSFANFPGNPSYRKAIMKIGREPPFMIFPQLSFSLSFSHIFLFTNFLKIVGRPNDNLPCWHTTLCFPNFFAEPSTSVFPSTTTGFAKTSLVTHN